MVAHQIKIVKMDIYFLNELEINLTNPNRNKMKIWVKAFDIYNIQNHGKKPHLGMGCGSCYPKVLAYLKGKYKGNGPT